MVRHVFIINPVAGKRSSERRLLERIDAAFPAGECQVAFTAGAGDARRLAEEAVARGEPVRIYACGGDGTLNEVVNAAAGRPWAAVTNVPVGTGNDFLRIFGKEGRRRFADVAALRDGPQAAMDLMDCNGLLGLDIACAGIDARVAAEVHRYKRLPFITGGGAYILSLASNVLRGITRPMTVEMGPIRHSGPTALLCVCNGRHYGGGFCPVPEAQPDDGVLDMLLVGEVNRRTFARYVRRYATGRYRECPELIQAWHGDRVTFTAEEELVAVVDGEVLRGRSFTIALSERKVNFFYPAETYWRESSQTANNLIGAIFKK
ncbi:MAG: diacylglycerol kinase family protein [Pseudoflavonifractor sp.]|nr:diacylglycerol kinase family protein [Pseudoflavonifractor sp.]